MKTVIKRQLRRSWRTLVELERLIISPDSPAFGSAGRRRDEAAPIRHRGSSSWDKPHHRSDRLLGV